MTIKLRNRLNIAFLIISILVCLVEAGLITFKLITKNYTLPELYFTTEPSGFFRFKYNVLYVYIGSIFLVLYTITTSIYVWLGFEKTQSSEVVYILLFLASFLFDSCRILVPFYYSDGPHSNFIFTLGTCTLLARILAPMALLSLNIFTSEEERQNTERNLLMIFVCAMTFAFFIPLNTSKIYSNFTIYYSFYKALISTSVTIIVLTIFVNFIKQLKNKGSQAITIGYGLLSFGYLITYDSSNLLKLVSGCSFMIIGTIIYLKSLHNSYMFEM